MSVQIYILLLVACAVAGAELRAGPINPDVSVLFFETPAQAVSLLRELFPAGE